MKKLFTAAMLGLGILAAPIFAATDASAVWLKPGQPGVPAPRSERAKCVCQKFECGWNGSEFRYDRKYTLQQVNAACPPRGR